MIQYFHHASYDPVEIERLFSDSVPDAAVVVPANIYWDIADLFRGEGRLGLPVLCVIYRNAPDCRILDPISLLSCYAVSISYIGTTRRYDRWRTRLSRHDLGNWIDVTARPVIHDSHFKVWEADTDLLLIGS